MAHRFTQHRRVAFSETDLAGIVHFANFYRYMEDCEHAFYRSLGYSVHGMDDGQGGWVTWPRVQAACDFFKPLRFEEEFEVELLVEELRNKTITHQFRFWKGEGDERQLGAVGKVIAVCARIANGEMKSDNIPESILERIEEAPAELLDLPQRKG